MNYEIRPLLQEINSADIRQACAIDKRWFPEFGIGQDELNRNLENQLSLGLFVDNVLHGFATFEILEGNRLPTDYVGNIKYGGKVLFIQQFTTDTNYAIGDSLREKTLLTAVEQKAKTLGCSEVIEALAVKHPYRRAINSSFNAYGFYGSQGYKIDKIGSLTWHPQGSDSYISCRIFRKNLRKK